MVYESDFYTTRRPYSRPTVTSYSVTSSRLPRLYGMGKGQTYHHVIPHVAHMRLTPVSAPAHTVRVRPSVILAEIDRIQHKMRPSLSYQPEEDFLNTRSITTFDDETRSIRAQTAALLKRIHEPLPRAKRIFPITVTTYQETPIPERITSDAYIRRLLGPTANVKQDIVCMSHYDEPAKRFMGKGHLACVSFAGGRAFPRRKNLFYDDDRVKNDVKYLSLYKKNRDAAEAPVTAEAATLSGDWYHNLAAYVKTERAAPKSRFYRPSHLSDNSDIPAPTRAETQNTLKEALNKKKQEQRDENARIAELARQEQLAKEATMERQKQLQNRAREEAERKAEEQRIEEEEKKAEQQRKEAERKEVEKRAEEERKAAEMKAEEERKEAERKAEEERKEAERKAEEERKEAERKAEEERKEAERKAEEERMEAQKKAEEERIEAEKKAEEERIEAEKKAEEQRKEAEKKAEEERIEAEKKAEEERMAAEKKAEEERKEAEKKDEEERTEAEKRAEDEERIETEKKDVEENADAEEVQKQSEQVTEEQTQDEGPEKLVEDEKEPQKEVAKEIQQEAEVTSPVPEPVIEEPMSPPVKQENSTVEIQEAVTSEEEDEDA